MHQAAIDLTCNGRQPCEAGTAPAHIENLMRGRLRYELSAGEQQDLAKMLSVHSSDPADIDRALDKAGYIPEQKQ